MQVFPEAYKPIFLKENKPIFLKENKPIAVFVPPLTVLCALG
jgi:hypothetical protein